jgi:hypothetical protein
MSNRCESILIILCARAAARRAVLGAAMVFALVGSGCGAGVSQDSSPAPAGEAITLPMGDATDERIFQIELRVVGMPEAGSWREWLQPATGIWRREREGKIEIFTGSEYALLEGAYRYLRRGSGAFLEPVASGTAALAPLTALAQGKGDAPEVTVEAGQTTITFKAGGHTIEGVVEAAVTPGSQAAADLFELPSLDEFTAVATEHAVGTSPILDVEPYWLGPSIAGRQAETVVEHYETVTPELTAEGWSRRDEARLYITFYTPVPGQTNATSPTPEPDEIQVSNEPIDLPVAQGAIAAANGRNGDLESEPWPRTTVTLQSGERVTVIPDRGEGIGEIRQGFLVLTDTTLVKVTGRFELDAIPDIAASLRRIP